MVYSTVKVVGVISAVVGIALFMLLIFIPRVEQYGVLEAFKLLTLVGVGCGIGWLLRSLIKQ